MISYYDLLGLIKEGKQPDNVKYRDIIYVWDGFNYVEGDYNFLTKQLQELNDDQDLILDNRIEIIEDKPNQILELDYHYKNTYGRTSDHRHSELEIIDKVNELTKAVNYLLKEDKHE